MATEHLKGEDIFEGSEDRVLRAVGDLVAGHATEQAGAPGGIVAGGLVIVFLGFGHAFVFLEVALGKGFALQDGHEIDGRDGKQYDYCNDVGEDLFFVIHDDSFFLVGDGW